MRLWIRPSAVVLIVVAALSLTAAPAHADGGSIFFVSKVDETRTINFYFNATNPSLHVQPDTVKVRVDGQEVKPKAVQPLEKVTKPPPQSAVLVIDTSGSMEGTRIEGAKDAARAFLSSVPPDVKVGLITFASKVVIAEPPTLDRAAVSRRVNELAAKGNTALFDAVQAATALIAREEGDRRILLLSDGEDKGSEASLEQARRSVARAREVRLDAVALELGPKAEADLEKFTTAGNGTLISENRASNLAKQFEEFGTDYLGRVLINLQVPPELAKGEITVAVDGRAGAQQISATRQFIVGSGPRAATPTPTQQVDTGPRAVAIDPGPWSRSVVPYAAMALVFAGVSVVLGFAFNAFQPVGQRGRISRRLAIYTLGGRPTPVAKEATGFGQGAVMQGAVDLAGRFVAQRSMEVGLRRRLDAAGLPLKPPEWVLIQVGSTLAVPVVLGVLTGSLVVALLGLFIGAAGPIVFLMIAESRRRQQFMDQLPDTLQLISGSLSTGYSLPQALDSVVQEGTEPVAGEFNRALVDHRLGRPIDDALRAIAVRMRSDEWHWVVMAIRIQREVGGNLAELLTTVADTLRDRARLHRQVKALSAEGRLSSYILTGLPIVFTIYLLITQPRYIGVLLTDPVGLLGLGLSVFLLIIGALWLRRIVKVEI